MQNAALIVAAGRGTRAGKGMPKQYRTIGGEPVLRHTIRAILQHPSIDAILTVIHQDDRDAYEAAIRTLDDGRILPPQLGGETRAKSVQNGLTGLSEISPKYVFIHDAARPFIDGNTLDLLFEALETSQGAFPAIPVADALWNRNDLTPIDREPLIRAQTPQAFEYPAIVKAHRSARPDARDDVEVALAAGLTVAHVPGNERNFKVTTKDDLTRANELARALPDIRTGTGYDVHAFEQGESVILNGITIPHDKKLKGHSDADVAMHAITDAIYGALAEGDIGHWFPPSDPKWKGAASDIFLIHAVERTKTRGFQITHIDCTIICEMPKIGPHAVAMREELSRITGLEMERISVKATTSERLGFTGRAEGIAAQATATLVRS